jgi:hypothetical protein
MHAACGDRSVGRAWSRQQAERAHLLLGCDRGKGDRQLLELGSLLEMSPSRGTQNVGRMRVTHEPCQFEAVFGLLEQFDLGFGSLPPPPFARPQIRRGPFVPNPLAAGPGVYQNAADRPKLIGAAFLTFLDVIV